MFSGGSANWVTLKMETLYVEIRHSHFNIFLVSRFKLVHELFFKSTVDKVSNKYINKNKSIC